MIPILNLQDFLFIATFIIILFEIIARYIINYLSKNYNNYLDKEKDLINKLLLYIRSFGILLFIYIIVIYFSDVFPILKGIYSWIINFIYAISIFLIISLIYNISKFFLKKVIEETLNTPIPEIFYGIYKVFLYLIGVIIILQRFNIEITPLLATLGIGGLAIGLALQPTLTNLFAGLYLISNRQIKVGDFIEIYDSERIYGFVEDINWRSITVRTLTNNIIIIPNAKLAESIFTNYSLPDKECIVKVYCGVDYSSDLNKVEQVAIKALKDLIKKEEIFSWKYEPKIFFTEFGDSNINFIIFVMVKHPIYIFRAKHLIIKTIKKEFDKHNIEISWPISKIYFMNNLKIQDIEKNKDNFLDKS